MLGRSRSARVAVGITVAVALIAAACGDDSDDSDIVDDPPHQDVDGDAAPFYGGHQSDLYSDDANWLCKPGIADNVCERDLDATIVHADGTTEVEPHQPAEDPAVDCFYIYPTASTDETPNSDLDVSEAEEIHSALNHAGRLTGACQVFAPVYRQLTLTMIGQEDTVEPNPWDVAYEDVIDAFRHYIDNESHGRGFVLVGHSQGAAHLRQLIMEEIDDEPELRDRLVSAVLLGWGVAVPDGEVVGGDFQNVPGCEAIDQVGCVVSYASFRSTAPPPENAAFGRPRDGEGTALCTNPASPEGGSAFTRPYFMIDAPEGALGGNEGPFADPERNSEITTPFVTYPDFIEVECARQGDISYLELTIHGDPTDERVDDIGGDLTPEWGMHRVDVSVAMGDLVDMVAAQAAAYTS